MLTLAMIEPNNWAGAAVALATCLGSLIWVAYLFAWDDPGRTQADRDNDIVRGLFDDRR